MSADRGILLGDVKKMYKKVCCMCRLLVLPKSSIKCINAFLMSIAIAVVVATALYFDLKGHSVITYGKIQKCINLYTVKLPVITKMFLFC